VWFGDRETRRSGDSPDIDCEEDHREPVRDAVQARRHVDRQPLYALADDRLLRRRIRRATLYPGIGMGLRFFRPWFARKVDALLNAIISSISSAN